MKPSVSGNAIRFNDKKWLKDEDRSYPVRIDPDTFVPSGEFIFCPVSEGQPDTSYAWDSPAYIGYVDDVRKNNRLCVAFNAENCQTIDSLLKGAKTVHSASLTLTADTDNSQGSNIFQLKAPVSAWNAYIVTWNTQPECSTNPERIVKSPAPGAGQAVEFDVTDLVNGWITGSELHAGFLLQSKIEVHKGDETTIDVMLSITKTAIEVGRPIPSAGMRSMSTMPSAASRQSPAPTAPGRHMPTMPWTAW